MIYHKTKRQKNFLNILKYAKKKYNCDNTIEKIQGRYEFNVYHNFKEDVKEYLKNFNIEVISVKFEGGDFVVVREIKGAKYE